MYSICNQQAHSLRKTQDFSYLDGRQYSYSLINIFADILRDKQKGEKRGREKRVDDSNS